AVIAASAASMALARLALGTPNTMAHRVWQIAVALFALVCISHLAAPFVQWIAGLSHSAAAGGVLLAVALVSSGLVFRRDPMPAVTRYVLCLACAAQAAAVAALLPTRNPDPPADPAGWIIAADLLALLAIQLYLLGEVSLVASVRRQLFAAQH